MIRVVIDTNVVVSALLRSGGLPEAVFNLAIVGDIQWSVSEPILAEYNDVLHRPRLAIDPAKAGEALRRIRSVALLVHPTSGVAAASDPDDNVFLECAQAADAAYLVTGNIRHFPARWETTRIVTPRQFIDIWTALPDEPHQPIT
jgi:putative PIN family toxin of toxin-antitoxin system